MASGLTNYGIATARVTITDVLPEINPSPIMPFFDFDAEAVKATEKSDFQPPVLIEMLEPEDKSFSVCFPVKRKLMVDNILVVSGGTSGMVGVPYITWTPVPANMPINLTLGTPTASLSVTGNSPSGLIYNKDVFPSYDLVMPSSGYSYPSGYIGPQWISTDIPFEDVPNDAYYVNQVQIGAFGGASQFIPSAYTWFPSGNGIKAIYQSVPRAGLWWGVESSQFLDNNTPFFLTLNIHSPPPSKANAETFLLLALGPNSTNGSDRIDIVISLNHKPKIVDYGSGGDFGSTGTSGIIVVKEYSDEISRVLSREGKVEIGVMTIAGRLVVYVDKLVMVYTRRSSTSGYSKFNPVDIKAGPIRVYGSNLSLSMHAAPMTFAPAGFFFPEVTDSTSFVNMDTSGASGSETVCKLPIASTDASDPIVNPGVLFGVDCEKFIQGPVTQIVGKSGGTGYHGDGVVYFSKADQTKAPSGDNRNIQGTAYWGVTMATTFIPFPGPTSGDFTYRGGCPYFFKIKGMAASTDPTIILKEQDVSDNVISVDEDISAPDYYHIKKSATIVLYNKKGITSGNNPVTGSETTNYDYLKDSQRGIRIEWGWNGDYTRTFTGLITNVSVSQTPGKEIITLTCQDYMYILENFRIVNSPLYDGMLQYYAIKDLAKRAGVLSCIADAGFVSVMDKYFLPTGFSFSKPAVVFQDFSTIMEAMNKIVQRDDTYVYFDELGKFHVDHIPGGILGSPAANTTINNDHKFTSDPSSENPNNIILNNKDINVSFEDTFNSISIKTLQRDTRNLIFLGLDASGTIKYTSGNVLAGQQQQVTYTAPPNKLLFRKAWYHDEAAYGSVNVAKNYLADYSRRMFYPILKTSFQTMTSGNLLKPLECVSVDDQTFRILGIKRSLNAENNDFTQTYDCEWLNGKNGN